MPLAADLNASTITSAVAKGLVRGVTVRSQVTPDYTYDPWAPTQPSQPNPLMQSLLDFVKPSVTIDTSAGPVVFEPAGPPTENNIPIVVIGGLALVIGLVSMIGFIARATKR